MNQYRRYKIECGAIATDNVRLRVDKIEAAFSGNSEARSYVVARFIGHLVQLGFTKSKLEELHIEYSRLIITDKQSKI